ncbi:MAG: vitamin K epoxide reductase family protein [bacterium]
MPEAKQHKHPWTIWAFLGLSIVGLFDSILLTLEHFTRRGLPCSLTGGCERVLTSKWSEIFGIPTAAFGILFYLVVLYLVIHALTHREALPVKLLLVWGAIGFMSSVWLVGLQAFVIRAWCQYCLLSALSSTLIFVTAIVHWRGSEFIKLEVKK